MELRSLDALRSELRQHKSNFGKLQTQRATYGAGEVPLRLMNDIESEQREIERLTHEIGILEATLTEFMGVEGQATGPLMIETIGTLRTIKWQLDTLCDRLERHLWWHRQENLRMERRFWMRMGSVLLFMIALGGLTFVGIEVDTSPYWLPRLVLMIGILLLSIRFWTLAGKFSHEEPMPNGSKA